MRNSLTFRCPTSACPAGPERSAKAVIARPRARMAGRALIRRNAAREHATVDALADLDLSGRLIHFATHGTFPSRDVSERNPDPFQASGLALAQDGELPSLALVSTGKSDDTLLTPERVLALRFDGSHVTLQACVSGLAKEGIGGDALGLDLAFLLSGAQSLLATHWNIPADASRISAFASTSDGRWRSRAAPSPGARRFSISCMGMAPRRLGASIIGPASVYRATGDSAYPGKGARLSKKNMPTREFRAHPGSTIGMSSGAA